MMNEARYTVEEHPETGQRYAVYWTDGIPAYAAPCNFTAAAPSHIKDWLASVDFPKGIEIAHSVRQWLLGEVAA